MPSTARSAFAAALLAPVALPMALAQDRNFGVGDSLALDQPRVAVGFEDPATGELFPAGLDFGFTMIADTGASGYLLSKGAHTDIFAGKTLQYPLQPGVYLEQGVGGFEPVRITAPLDATISDFGGITGTGGGSFVKSGVAGIAAPNLDLGSFDGIVGMPGMLGRGVHIDLSTMTPDNPATGSMDYIHVDLQPSFTSANTGPTDDVHRFQFSKFPIDPGAGQLPGAPTPSSSDLPLLGGVSIDGVAANKPFLFDTGAQLTMISSDFAERVGIDLDDPNLEYDLLEVGGVGGTTVVPIVRIPSFALATMEGYDLEFTAGTAPDGTQDIIVGIIDIPGLEVDGILGFNFFTTGYLNPLLASLEGNAAGAADGAFLEMLFDFTGDDWTMELVENPLYREGLLTAQPETVQGLGELTPLAGTALPGPGVDPAELAATLELLGFTPEEIAAILADLSSPLGTGLTTQALFAWPAFAVPEPSAAAMLLATAASLTLRPRRRA